MSEKSSKGVYFGGQVNTGGGEWIGSEPYNLESLVKSIPAPASANAPVARKLDPAFAELRQLAEDSLSGAELDSVLKDIEILQSELESATGPDDGLCTRTLRRIAVSLPNPGPALKNLSEHPLVAGRLDPTLRTAFDAAANL